MQWKASPASVSFATKPDNVQATISKSQQKHKYQYVAIFFRMLWRDFWSPTPPKKTTDQILFFNSRDYKPDPSGLEKGVIQ